MERHSCTCFLFQVFFWSCLSLRIFKRVIIFSGTPLSNELTSAYFCSGRATKVMQSSSMSFFISRQWGLPWNWSPTRSTTFWMLDLRKSEKASANFSFLWDSLWWWWCLPNFFSHPSDFPSDLLKHLSEILSFFSRRKVLSGSVSFLRASSNWFSSSAFSSGVFSLKKGSFQECYSGFHFITSMRLALTSVILGHVMSDFHVKPGSFFFS